MSREAKTARHGYRPVGRIQILFIAEAPPADPSRFVYFEQVERHDWLYLALVRVLFDDACELSGGQLRKQKPEYLARFCKAIYYLTDASDAPMPPKASPAVKRRHLRVSLSRVREGRQTFLYDDEGNFIS